MSRLLTYSHGDPFLSALSRTRTQHACASLAVHGRRRALPRLVSAYELDALTCGAQRCWPLSRCCWARRRPRPTHRRRPPASRVVRRTTWALTRLSGTTPPAASTCARERPLTVSRAAAGRTPALERPPLESGPAANGSGVRAARVGGASRDPHAAAARAAARRRGLAVDHPRHPYLPEGAVPSVQRCQLHGVCSGRRAERSRGLLCGRGRRLPASLRGLPLLLSCQLCRRCCNPSLSPI